MATWRGGNPLGYLVAVSPVANEAGFTQRLRPAVWTAIVLRRPSLCVIGTFTATVLALVGVYQVETEVGYRAFLGSDHPVVREFDDFVSRFDGGLPLVAVWTCRSTDACVEALDVPSLRMAAAIASQLSASDVIRRVDTPATTPVLVRQEIGFPKARVFVEDGRVSVDRPSLRDAVMKDPLWLRRLVSEDGMSGAVIAHLRDSSGSVAEAAYAAMRRAVAPFDDVGFDYAFVGGPVEFVVAARDLQRNTQRIMPLMVALIACALVLLFASPAAAVTALLCVGVAVVWTLGVMGWLGWAQNSLTQILPPLVLVIGVCDAIHFLGRYSDIAGTANSGGAGGREDSSRRLLSNDRSIVEAASRVGPACGLTTLTTVAGFLSLAVSRLESVARFGVLAAVASIAALVLTFTLLPLVVRVMPRRWFRADRARRVWRHALGVSAGLTTGELSVAIMALGAAVVVVAGWGMRDLRVDARFEDLYGADSDVVRWTESVARNLRAPDTLEIAIEAPPGVDRVNALGLALASQVQEAVTAIDGFGPALSVVDPMKRLNSMLHRDDLPLASEVDDKGRPTSVYRLLRARSGRATLPLVDADRIAYRISFESPKFEQEGLRARLALVSDALTRVLPEGWSAVVTGPLAVVSKMIDAIRQTQLRSFALAALSVFLLVAAFFRSLCFGALAMIPTLFPVLVTLGMMGWMGIALDIGTSMVAAVILGLAIDDAIHVVTAYRLATQRGVHPKEASRVALLETGQAVVTTSLALAAGFTTLTLSAWQSIASFGVIASIAVLAALVASLLILPAVAARMDVTR